MERGTEEREGGRRKGERERKIADDEEVTQGRVTGRVRGKEEGERGEEGGGEERREVRKRRKGGREIRSAVENMSSE